MRNGYNFSSAPLTNISASHAAAVKAGNLSLNNYRFVKISWKYFSEKEREN